MARNRRLKPGTVCTTVNTDHPALNDGMLVVVLGVHFAESPSHPYRVARLDGLPLGSVSGRNGSHGIYTDVQALCCRRKLRPVDEGESPQANQAGAGRLSVPA